jgi:hypothetical protein
MTDIGLSQIQRVLALPSTPAFVAARKRRMELYDSSIRHVQITVRDAVFD